MDRNLFSPLGIFFLIIFGIESIASLLGNGFILIVNGQSWIHSRKMIPCDFLLTTLSLPRLLWQLVVVINQFTYFSSPETYIHSTGEQVSSITWIYLNVTSLWSATWLSVFCCVKVTNFGNPLFAWLKPRIGALVPRFFGISLLTFLICSIPVIMTHYEEEKHHNLTGNPAENTSLSKTYGSSLYLQLSPLQLSLTTISFCICVSASVLLLVSLRRHRKNLRKSGFSTEDLSTQAHLRVMKPLLLLLFFYVVHFPAMIIVLGNILQFGKLERLISDVVLVFYPSAHSVILIFTNPKLKKACIHILNLRNVS